MMEDVFRGSSAVSGLDSIHRNTWFKRKPLRKTCHLPLPGLIEGQRTRL
jgi:hypothetical protein